MNFFQRLSRRKRVDSGGRAFNNIGGPIPAGSPAKLDFLRAYKFNLAFENASLPGYTTEKIVEAYVRYIKGWATIPNIKCPGQYEIDLIAIDPVNFDRYHICLGSA